MADIKLLIDTNIIIALEDAGEVQASFADLVRKCGENGIRIFVHEASLKDIDRDKNINRRKATHSKIRKFVILKGVATPAKDELTKRFGLLTKPNDLIDASLLAAIDANIVDLLVSEDDGLHRRARRAGLAERVLTVAEALIWIKQTYEPQQIELPAVEGIKAYGLDTNDPIFVGLRSDYPGFDAWLEKCRKQHRECWVITEGGLIAALVIRNDEMHADARTLHVGPKIMKICTLKVADSHQGKKYGEQLLKQILWHAQRNSYDLVYITAFPKQEALIRLLEEYGFNGEGKRDNGEVVFEKPLGRGPVVSTEGISVLDLDRRHYPRFIDTSDIRKFVVPIREPYLRKLFPEVGHPVSVGASRKPGNTIRKVYLCRAMAGGMRPADILLFYTSKGSGYGSQCLTSVGIVEQVRHSGKVDQVIGWTAKRSVYSAEELSEKIKERETPLKIIDFLLIGHVEPAIPLDQLIHEGILRAAPQSICQLDELQYSTLKPLLHLGFKF
jgi:ribosomal protein S18 acetylase RimI-like enzyme/rRNA-processing protein FCF1